MNKFSKVFIFLLFVLINLNSCYYFMKNPVQQSEAALKKALHTLVKSCQQGNFEKAANYIVYRQNNEANRKWQDTYNIAIPPEKKAVIKMCGKLSRIFAEKNEVSYQSYTTQTESEGEWHIIKYLINKDEVNFAFLSINGNYALGDID